MDSMNRRSFLATGAVLAGAAAGLAEPKKATLKKAVKFGMIRSSGTLLDKLLLAKSCGFEGVEIDSPSNLNLKELVEASKMSGVKIHGTIDSVHWKETLSSPDAAVRARGLAGLMTAIRDCHTVGGDTALLVPGVARNGVTYEQCYERSQAEVRKAIPLAEDLGVKIAIEVVWNDFITKPEQLVQYVDDFKTPHVGAYFDASNMLKYGVPAATWIRKLGERMLKLDFKGYSMTKNWVPIGEGDENWPEVLIACAEVGYNSWATAEVDGGGKEVLTDISQRMDKILELKKD